MKPFSKTAQGIRGLTLVEVIMGLGVFSMISLAVAVLNGQMLRQVAVTSELSEIENFNLKLTKSILNSEGWRRSLADPRNPLMACLRTPGSVCVNSVTTQMVGFNEALNPPLTLLNPAGKDDETYTGPAPADGVVYDSTNPANGITLSGKKCGPHSLDPTLKSYRYPSVDCPLRFELRWYAVSGAANPLIGVYGILHVSDQANLHVNTNRFSIGTCSAVAGTLCTAMSHPIYRAAQ